MAFVVVKLPTVWSSTKPESYVDNGTDCEERQNWECSVGDLNNNFGSSGWNSVWQKPTITELFIPGLNVLIDGLVENGPVLLFGWR